MKIVIIYERRNIFSALIMRMQFSTDQKILRDYFLGKITNQEELENVEIRLLKDDDFFLESLLQEDDLIEEYVTERTDEQIACLEKFIFSSRDRVEKVRNLISLLNAIASEKVMPVKYERNLLSIVNQIKYIFKSIKNLELKFIN